MTNIEHSNSKMFSYHHKTVARAKRSLLCSPFNLCLLSLMRHQSVPLKDIAHTSGFQKGYTKQPLSELGCDQALGWLIQVGIIRREVDGQGITDSFRLTPLGHQLLGEFEGRNWSSPSWGDRLADLVIRWWRLPF